MNKPDICIWHGPDCADGFTAAWAIHMRWPDVEFHYAQYGDTPPNVAGKSVLIVDFSYPEDVMRAISAEATWVYVCDHHKSAGGTLKALVEEGLIKATFDLERSGAALAWEYAWGPTAMPRIIEHVQDRDLWRFKLRQTREISAALASYDHDFDEWTRLAKMIEDPPRRDVVAREGAAIIRARDKEMHQAILATARPVKIAGHVVPCVNAPYTWASDIGNRLCEMPDVPFAAVWYMRPDGSRQFSLRSSSGFDVSEIAKLFRGGGHAAAAGFTLEPFDVDEAPIDSPVPVKGEKV